MMLEEQAKQTYLEGITEGYKQLHENEMLLEGMYRDETGCIRKRKVMISQPMNGLSDEEILKIRNRFKQDLEDRGYEVVDTYFEDFSQDSKTVVNKPVWYLAKSIEKMSECDVVFFAEGFENARGCRVEYEVASWYGFRLMFENYPFKDTVVCECGGDQNGKSKPYYVEHRILADGESQSVQLRNDTE